MSPIIQLILISGTVVAVFVFLAALVWGIRTRRGEENFVPAPKALKNYNRQESGGSTGSEAVPDWSRGVNPESPDVAKGDSVPDWLRQPNPDVRGTNAPGQVPTGAGPQSSFGDFLRNAVPQLSTVMELSKMAKMMQAAGELTGSNDERGAALLKALDQMLEQQPQNEFLIQMRDSFQSADVSETETDAVVQVIRVAGRNVVRIDGIEYYSPADIPDPALRDEARRMLLDLDDPKPL
ncbi:MAG: hypothetical protein WBM17_05940 [Anaerolineales bacterium]